MAETRNQKAPKAEYPAPLDRPLVAEPDMKAKAAPAKADNQDDIVLAVLRAGANGFPGKTVSPPPRLRWRARPPG